MCTIFIDKIHIDQVTINYQSSGNEGTEEETFIATISVGGLLITAPSSRDGDITLQSPCCPMNTYQLWRVTSNFFPRPAMFLISMESMQYSGYFIGVKGTEVGDNLGLSNEDIESNGWSTEATLAPTSPIQNNATRFFIGVDGAPMMNSKLIQVLDDRALEFSINKMS